MKGYTYFLDTEAFHTIPGTSCAGTKTISDIAPFHI